MSSLGERIKSLRIEKGFTQAQLGEKVNLGKSSISQYENNFNMPDPILLSQIASALDSSVDYLLGLTNSRLLPENAKKHKLYDVIARAKDLPEENIDQVADALEALLKHHAEKIKKKRDSK